MVEYTLEWKKIRMRFAAMDYSYHNHTWRCGHASGTEQEYIEKAIGGGIRHMGFSEHIPFRFPDGYESSYRAPVESMEGYFQVLRDLRERYRDRLELWIGFEMEYYPEYFDQMLWNARTWGGEYLILGQHFIYHDEHPESAGAPRPMDPAENLKEYVSCVISAMESGWFSYVAHPDVYRFAGDEKIYGREIRRLCEASRRLEIPLEINFLGIRDHRHYPNLDFWRIVGEEKSPVTFGMDAHDVSSAYDAASLEKALGMVKRYGLNYIGRPRLRPLGKTFYSA